MRKSLTALLLVAALPTLAFAMPDAGHGERQASAPVTCSSNSISAATSSAKSAS